MIDGVVIAELHAMMLGQALRKGLSEHDARDVVQEAWVRLMREGWLERTLDPDHLRKICSLHCKWTIHNEWTKHNRLKRGGGLTVMSLDGIMEEPPSVPSTQARDHDMAYLAAELQRVGAHEHADDVPYMTRTRHRRKWRAKLKHCEHLLTH